MQQDNPVSMKHDVGRIIVKVVVAVLALIVIRVIMDHLPMLKNANPIIVGGSSAQAGNISQSAAQAYSNWLSSLPANATYGDMQKAAQQILGQYPGVGIIFPMSIANAAVDSVIFFVLVLSALEFKRLVEVRSKRLPEGGVMVLLLVVTVIVALAYSSYGGIFPPLLGSDSDIYGWFFLVLGLVPLAGLIIVGARNMNAVTELVFASAGSIVSLSSKAKSAQSSNLCSKCGNLLDPGAKFCNSCGAPVASTAEVSEILCATCGTKNTPAAKFCESCGKPLGVV